MKVIFKSIMWVSLFIAAIILPFYLWSVIDKESYENYLLKSVSPLTQKSRNSILERRKSSSQSFKERLNK